jgi:hypothetical protein
MIDKTLDRNFVLAQADLARQEFARLTGKDPGGGRPRRSARRLDAPVEEAAADAEPDEDDGGPFIARDAFTSLVQSAMEQKLREEAAAEEELAPADADAPVRRSAFGHFQPLDPGWAGAVAAVILEKWKAGPADFWPAITPPEAPLAADARIILVGDWGTGDLPAQSVAAQIGAQIAGAGPREVHVIHLGDVYFSGEEWEAEERFLRFWPVGDDNGDRHRSWALNGNHDMYSGGYGYFNRILADERFSGHLAHGHRLSRFRLRNDDWQILGIDSSWSEDIFTSGQTGRLAGDQSGWIERCLADEPARRSMLLSHHQFLGDHDQLPCEMSSALAGVLAEHEVDAWFWGHEHRCARYGPRPGLRYAACIGHGAMPVGPKQAKAISEGWELDATVLDADSGDERRRCGFAVVDLDGRDASVRYIDELGEEYHPETLP